MDFWETEDLIKIRVKKVSRNEGIVKSNVHVNGSDVSFGKRIPHEGILCAGSKAASAKESVQMIRRRFEDARLTSKVHETWTPPMPGSRLSSEGKAVRSDWRLAFKMEDEFDKLSAAAGSEFDYLKKILYTATV